VAEKGIVKNANLCENGGPSERGLKKDAFCVLLNPNLSALFIKQSVGVV